MKMRFKDLNIQNQSGKEQFMPTDTSHATWLRRCSLVAEDNYRLSTAAQELPLRFAGEKRARTVGTEKWISPERKVAEEADYGF